VFGGRKGPLKTLAVVALKGGTGKTTVSVNLAARAFGAGLRVLLADMDPQASASDWAKARRTPGPMTIPVKVGSLAATHCTAQSANTELMILDTRASSQMDTLAAVKAAELSLVVVRPTVIDLRAIAATVELLRPLRKPLAFVINQAPSQRIGRDPVLVSEAIDLLLGYGVAVAPVGLRARQIYQTSFSAGLTPFEEDPDGAAGQEVDRLWAFAKARLWPEPAPILAGPIARRRMGPYAADMTPQLPPATPAEVMAAL
jgi:chromosome partitioning protein